MADTRSQQKAFSLKNLPQVTKDSFLRIRTAVQRFIETIIALISSVTNFFMGIFAVVFNAYERVALLIIFMVDCIRQIFHCDYRAYLSWLFTMPMNYYRKCKEQTRKHLWTPIANSLRRKVNQISRATRSRLRDSAVYARGFCEICRRLFLLASDYTPGGKVTVTIFLAIIAIIFLLKILTVVRVVIQIVQLVYSIVAFLLHPLFLTLKDILSVFDPLFQIVFVVIRITLRAFLSVFKAIGTFLWLNVVSIVSGLYRCWQIFVNSTVVRFIWKAIWSLLAKTAYVLLEYFVFVFLPFMSKASFYGAELFLGISSLAYNNFFVVRVKVEHKFKYLGPTGIGSCVFILWALLLAFRFRNRLSGTFLSEIDDKECTITSYAYTVDRKRNSPQRERNFSSRISAKYDSSRRNTTNDESSLRFRGTAKGSEERGEASEDGTEGHIHYSSQVHICTEYITGTCQRGSKCDSHHCSLPFHWQYRLSLEGWKSFSPENNCRIEELFCDPKNDVVTVTDVDVAFKSYSREASKASHRKDSVKLDFENMRVEKTYHRADLRRLSTESYVKLQRKSLGTQWVWYRREDSGDWAEYGVKSESDVKQEDLESAFLRREGNYNFTREGQEFRLQFFMNPMCEKSFRPYSKRIVRRRPAFKSPEDIKKLTMGDVEKRSWFSLRNIFRWR